MSDREFKALTGRGSQTTTKLVADAEVADDDDKVDYEPPPKRSRVDDDSDIDDDSAVIAEWVATADDWLRAIPVSKDTSLIREEITDFIKELNTAPPTITRQLTEKYFHLEDRFWTD